MQINVKIKHEVTIRQPKIDDKELFLHAMTASQTLHHPWVSPPLTPQAFDEFIQCSEQSNQRSFLVFNHLDNLVGVINLNEIVRGVFQNAFLGFYGICGFTNQGYMHAGLNLVLNQAFQDLGLHRIEANIQPNNFSSIQLIRKVGFRYEGFSPRYLKINEVWQGHEHWAMTFEDYHLNDPISIEKACPTLLKDEIDFITTPNEQFNAEIEKGLMASLKNMTGIIEGEKRHTIYACENQKIIGGIIAYLHGTILWIDSIYVTNNRRQQGIGKKLMEQLTIYSKNWGATELQLNTFFPEAHHFFIHQGFDTLSVMQNWKYGLTCYLMMKRIS